MLLDFLTKDVFIEIYFRKICGFDSFIFIDMERNGVSTI